MKALLWDMDGTLIDSEPLHERALASALASQGLAPPADLHDRILGMTADAVHDWLGAELGLSVPLTEWLKIKYGFYMSGAKDLKALPGALEAWRAAEAKGVLQAVASNSDRIIVETNLSQVDLIKPGLVTVTRNDVRKGKPDPEIYLRAAYLLGVDPSEAIVIEDSGTGARAGLAAGMQVFIVPYSDVEVEGARKLQSLDELQEVIES